MPFFEDKTIFDSIEIRTQPEDIFGFLTTIVDDKSYRQWHSKDHVRFKWVHGRPWAKGSVFYAEEYLHGKLHKFKFEIAEIEPPKRIEYRPVSRLLRFFFPKNEFIIEKKGDVSIFTASGTFRVGGIGGDTFFCVSARATHSDISSRRPFRLGASGEQAPQRATPPEGMDGIYVVMYIKGSDRDILTCRSINRWRGE